MNPLFARLSGLYSHLATRTLFPYWQARSPHVFHCLDLQTEDVLLEIGCGSGLWTSYVAPRVQTTYALDTNLNSIRHALFWKSPRPPFQSTIDVNFVQASGMEIPFADATFTKVFGIDVIEHIPDGFGAISELTRVLKPKGRMVLTTLLRDRPAYIRKIIFPDHLFEYGVEDFQALFCQAGLQIAQTFYFYYAPTMIARELNILVEGSRIGRVIGVDLITGVVWRLICSLERLHRWGTPGGIGIMAIKGE